MSALPAPITLLKGDDVVVLRDAVRQLVDDLVGSEDRALVVEEVEVGAHAAEDTGRDPLVALVDAAQTPPFLTDLRVVVGRVTDKRERNDLVQPLTDYLLDPLPSTRLVLEWQGGRIPKALAEGVTRCGGQLIDTSPGRKLGEWVTEQLAESGLKVDADGRKRLVSWVGDEPGRLVGLIELLRSTFGAGTKITAAEIEPFLGDDGGVPPWDLTDAIDRGDRKAALDLLQRMIGAGDRHPFQVLATLHTHYARMLRLEGSDVAGEREAADLLGMKGSTFSAKKALGQARRLGHERVVRAIGLLADADLDLRGGKAWPAPLVLEVLVARLASLAR
ncbi:MAG: DNA polymerase III subunit delta [Microthrixaceae bacterium]